MPKSRGRKPRKQSSKQSSAQSSHRSPDRPPWRTSGSRDHRPPGGPTELQDFLPLIRASDAAEARGDAAGALDVIMQKPIGPDGQAWWRPWRVARLMQLFVLGPLLPGWATSRWILAQAAQSVGAMDTLRHRRAMTLTLKTLGGAGVSDPAALGLTHERVMDHDWVFRQLALYELGGLDAFLRRVASPDLVAGADRIERWARAPMGGYRFVGEGPVTLRWAELASGEIFETANLGAASLLEPGDCVIGRVVPIADGLLFESAPLFVPETTAVRVAADPGCWVEAVGEACQDASIVAEQRVRTGGHDFQLLTDVPLVVRRLAHHRTGVAGSWTDSCVALVLAALDGQVGGDDDKEWPVIAAAVMEPFVIDRLAGALTPVRRHGLVRLADHLAGPASEVCVELAGARDEAA